MAGDLSEDRRRALRGIEVFTVLRGLGIPGFQYLFPLYILVLGYHTLDLGPIATYSSLLAALTLPLLGYLTDVGHAVEVGILSGVLIFISLITPVAIPSYAGFIIAYSSSYLGMMGWQVSRGSMTAKIVRPKELGRRFATFTLLYNSMNVVTPFALSAGLSIFSYTELMLYLSLVVAGGTALFAVMVYPPYRRVESRYQKTLPQSSKDEWLGCRDLPAWRKLLCIYRRSVIINRKLVPLAVFGILDRYGWMLWMPMINAYLKEFLGFSDLGVGIYNTLRGAAMLIASLPAGHLADRIGAVKALIINEFLGALGVSLLITGSRVFIYVSAFFAGWSIAFWIVGYNTATALVLGPRNVGKVRSGIDSLRTYTGIPAPIIGSWLFNLYGPLTPFMTGALLMMAATTPLFKWLKRRESTFDYS